MVLEAATAADITTTLTALKSVFTFMIGCLGDVVTVVLENPLLMIPIGMVLTYAILKVFRVMF